MLLEIRLDWAQDGPDEEIGTFLNRSSFAEPVRPIDKKRCPLAAGEKSGENDDGPAFKSMHQVKSFVFQPADAVNDFQGSQPDLRGPWNRSGVSTSRMPQNSLTFIPTLWVDEVTIKVTWCTRLANWLPNCEARRKVP